MENFLTTFLISLAVALQFLMVICIFFLIKSCNTYAKRKSIINAIYSYQIERYKAGLPCDDVDYTDIEPYEKTLCRLWDWSNKRILPNEKYEIIKKYLK